MNKGHLKEYWPLLLIMTAVLFFFRGPIFLGKSFCVVNTGEYAPWTNPVAKFQDRSNQACNDQVFAYYPRKELYRQSLRSGAIARWNDRIMGGYPVGADPQYGWYDPFNLVFSIFSLEAAFKFAGFIQWFLGGFFAYFFLREIGLSRLAGVVGGLAFLSEPFFITKLAWPSYLATAVWLPFLLWTFERMMKSGRHILYIPAMALGIALSFFGGVPPVFILTITSWFLYCFLRIAFLGRENLLKGARRYGIPVLASVILGAMLCAPQLVPTYNVSRFSERKTIPYEQHKRVSLPVEFVLTLANPYLLGRPTQEGWGAFAGKIRPGADDWVSPTSFLEDSHYVGWAVMLLAIWGVRFRWRDRRVVIMVVVAGLALLTLYGTPVLRLAYLLIPGFKSARPDRIIFVWGAFMAFLAGVGFDELIRGENDGYGRFARMMLIIISVIALVMALAGIGVRFFPRWIPEHVGMEGSVTGRLAAWRNLLLFASYMAPTWSADALLMAVIAFISAAVIYAAVRYRRAAFLLLPLIIVDADIVAGRFLTFRSGWFPEKAPPVIEYFSEYALTRRIARFGDRLNIFPSNAPFIYGIADAQGRSGLLLKHWGRYFDLIEEGSFWRAKRLVAFQDSASLASPLLNAAGVKYVLSDDFILFDPDSAQQYNLVHASDLYIYENTEVFPEAWVAPFASFVGDEESAAKLMANENFNPYFEVALEGEGKVEDKRVAGGEAKVIRHSHEHVEVILPESANGWLVLADAWYPGWSAEVDGTPRKVWKADLAFKAVKVNPGDNVVTFKYKDRAHYHGWILAVAGAGICLIILIVWMINRRRVARAEGSSGAAGL